MREKIEGSLPSNAKLNNMRPAEFGTEIEIDYRPSDPGIEVGGIRRIEIVKFRTILESLRGIFKQEEPIKRDFTDPVMRSIQHIVKLLQSRR